MLGLEAARGLLHLGMDVSVVHLSPYIMERQLDETAAKMLQLELEAQGMKFLLSKNSEAIVGRKRVKELRFTDGTRVETDLVVMAVGIKPNVMLAQSAGIEVNRGIIVNDYMETSIPGSTRSVNAPSMGLRMGLSLRSTSRSRARQASGRCGDKWLWRVRTIYQIEDLRCRCILGRSFCRPGRIQVDAVPGRS